MSSLSSFGKTSETKTASKTYYNLAATALFEEYEFLKGIETGLVWKTKSTSNTRGLGVCSTNRDLSRPKVSESFRATSPVNVTLFATNGFDPAFQVH